MILDATALKNKVTRECYSTLINGLDVNKIIFLLPQGSQLCTPSFLSKLIDLGIYNFTTNIDGVKYLYNKPNTLKDVEHVKDIAKKKEQELAKKIEEAKLAAARATSNVIASDDDESSDFREAANSTGASVVTKSNSISIKPTIIGIKNVTEHAGATTLTYILKRELATVFGQQNIVAIEVNSKDFSAFNKKKLFSPTSEN